MAAQAVAAVPPAGKPLPRGPGAKECISPSHHQLCVTPERVHKLRQLTHPGLGQRRSRSMPNASVEQQRHGTSTKASIEAAVLLNPPRLSLYRQQLKDLQQQIYSTSRNAPLGHSHDQSSGLPSGMDTLKTTFGVVTVKDMSAGEVVSPSKTATQVQREAEVGRHLYRISHEDYGVGETVDRNYDWSVFSREDQYGMPTPHDNTGMGVRKAMHWATDAQSETRAAIVPKQLDDFREKTQPQLGKVLDPMADTLNVPDGHTYGVIVQPDEYSVGELAHMTGPSAFLQCSHFDRGILSTIRQHLKKHHYTDFSALLDAAQQEAGWKKEEVRELFFQFHVPLEPEMLELLLGWCTDVEGHVAVDEMIALLNWQEEISTELDNHMRDLVGGRGGGGAITRDTRMVVLDHSYKTSAQTHSSSTGRIQTANYRSFGVPTIRSDRPAPTIRRVGDNINYGDESDAYGLMYPSMYSNQGVYEQDFFAPLEKHEVREMFESIGVQMSDEDFEKVWSAAVMSDPNGQVCVESFRAALEHTLAEHQ